MISVTPTATAFIAITHASLNISTMISTSNTESISQLELYSTTPTPRTTNAISSGQASASIAIEVSQLSTTTARIGSISITVIKNGTDHHHDLLETGTTATAAVPMISTNSSSNTVSSSSMIAHDSSGVQQDVTKLDAKQVQGELLIKTTTSNKATSTVTTSDTIFLSIDKATTTTSVTTQTVTSTTTATAILSDRTATTSTASITSAMVIVTTIDAKNFNSATANVSSTATTTSNLSSARQLQTDMVMLPSFQESTASVAPNLTDIAENETMLLPPPLTKMENIVANVVQAIGSLFVIGCCCAVIIFFIILKYGFKK